MDASGFYFVFPSHINGVIVARLMRHQSLRELWSSIELEHERRLTREQFEALASEIRALVGDKLKGHVDGDSESSLFKR